MSQVGPGLPVAIYFIQFSFISENDGTAQKNLSLKIIPGLPEKNGRLRPDYQDKVIERS